MRAEYADVVKKQRAIVRGITDALSSHYPSVKWTHEPFKADGHHDRLDLTVEVPPLPPSLLGAAPEGESSSAVRDRVVAARERQRFRYAADGILTNAALTPALVARCAPVGQSGLRLLDQAAARLSLSARAYDRVRKVARTIADLAGADQIGVDHVAEALQFRMAG